MSIISELPDGVAETKVSLEWGAATAPAPCAGCAMAGTCRVAAGLARLARIRGKLVPSDDNMWLRGRIDEYLGLQVCLAGLFGMSPASLGRPQAVAAPARSVTLEFALRHREVRVGDHGPVGIDGPRPRERVLHTPGDAP